MKTFKRVLKFVGKFYTTFIITGLLFIAVAVIFFLVYPFNVGQVKGINIIGTVQSGNLITYTVDYCQNVGQGVRREVHRYLIPEDSGAVNPIELSPNPSLETLQSAQGCRTGAPVKLPIETSTPAGSYRLMIRVIYKFPLRDITVEGESLPFPIIKPDILGQLQNINTQLESINGYLETDPTYTPIASIPAPVANVAPSTSTADNSTPTDSTPEQRSGILQGTIDTINGILRLGR